MTDDSKTGSEGANPESAASRLASGRAWDDFCEVIRLAGHTVDRWGDEIGDLERAEWYRFTQCRLTAT